MKIQILKMYNFFLVLSVCTDSEKGVQIFDESCGEAQDPSSPVKDERPLSNSSGFTGQSNFEATI